MASTNKTNHLALNQWAAEDPVLREDFNSDNAKIDAALASMSTQLADLIAGAGNCRIGTGSYVGTGTVGINSKNTLIFDGKPAWVLVFDPNYGGTMHILGEMAANALTVFRYSGSAYGNNIVTWGDNAVNWYCNYSGGALSGSPNVTAPDQANESGKTYHYVYLEVCA